MDAVQLLKSDHLKVKGLFLDFEMAPRAQPERRRAIAERLIRELLVHERIEEELFYPAFRRALGEKGEEEVEHSKEEHAEVDSLLQELQGIDIDAPDFEDTLKELQEKLVHHIEDEETKMLPAAERWMAPQLEPLGREMLEYKEKLLKQLTASPEAGSEGRPREREQTSRR